jgi:hypothetical protein
VRVGQTAACRPRQLGDARAWMVIVALLPEQVLEHLSMYFMRLYAGLELQTAGYTFEPGLGQR